MNINGETSVCFIGNYNEFAVQLLNKYGIPYQHIPEESFTSSSFIKQELNRYHKAVFDSYLFSQDFIDKICSRQGKTILIDDFHQLDLSSADMVINFTINAGKLKYTNTVKALGPAYFIAKPELKPVRIQNYGKTDNAVKNILVFLGGAFNDRIVLEHIADTVASHVQNTSINIISGIEPSTKNIDGNSIKYFSPSYDIEKYFAQADLCITGGGLAKYESAYCGIPCGVISLTKEQHQETMAFESEGLCYNLGPLYDLDPVTLSGKIAELTSNTAARNKISDRAFSTFHTDSSEKLAEMVLNV